MVHGLTASQMLVGCRKTPVQCGVYTSTQVLGCTVVGWMEKTVRLILPKWVMPWHISNLPPPMSYTGS